MKKLYQKSTVHPTPPVIMDHLSLLPATIFTLTTALSIQDREILAYLLSSASNNHASNNIKQSQKTTTTSRGSASFSGGGVDHVPCFSCSCFRCYTTYWVRWDSSPNRQLIHEVIEAFEEGLSYRGKKGKNKKVRSKGRGEFNKSEQSRVNKEELNESKSVQTNTSTATGGENGGGEKKEMEKGTVKMLVSFIGEKIWGIWN